MITWVGGLVYICFVLAPMYDQRALPPLFVRMLGLMRFRVFNLVCLAVLIVTSGIMPFFVGAAGTLGPTPWNILRVLLLIACLVSTVQLNQFLSTALAVDRANPVPSILDEDPARVDKLLRQINKVCRALVFAGLAIVVLTVLVR